MAFLPRKVRRVYIMLGNGCNLNCRYCIQHPLVQGALTGKVNHEIYGFFEQLADEKGSPLRITFYGGEPLLYFQTIQEISANKPDFYYGVITNGKALTAEMVEFFNGNNFNVSVSWDGRASINTRGFDVMAANRENILALNKLCLTGVISSQAYPMEILEDFQRINDEYSPLHDGRNIDVNLDAIMDSGLPDKSLLNIDYERVAREAEELARLYFTPAPEHYVKNSYILGIIKLMQNFMEKDTYTAPCGNGLDVINIDLEGNLYPCHNSRDKLGDIHTPYFTYLQNLLASDPTPAARRICEKCAAYPACHCGCKLVVDKSQYCKLKQALFLPMFRAFAEGVSKMEATA